MISDNQAHQALNSSWENGVLSSVLHFADHESDVAVFWWKLKTNQYTWKWMHCGPMKIEKQTNHIALKELAGAFRATWFFYFNICVYIHIYVEHPTASLWDTHWYDYTNARINKSLCFCGQYQNDWCVSYRWKSTMEQLFFTIIGMYN